MLFLKQPKIPLLPQWHGISFKIFPKLMGQTQDFDQMFGVSANLILGSLIHDYVSSHDTI
jgi:hypothetical protein